MSRYKNINVCGYLFILAIMFITLKMPGFNCDLDTALFKALPKVHSLAYSPYALHFNLNSTAVGARHETRKEIFAVIKGYIPPPVADKIHGTIYLNKRLNLVKCFPKHLKMPIKAIDYSNKDSVARVINKFVKKNTGGLIEANIVLEKKLRAKTLMNVVTVHNIKAEWKKKFKSQKSNEFPNKMMHLQDKFLYGKLKNLNAIAVEIPFKTKETKMLVIMPNDKNLDHLASKLTGKKLSKITKQLKLTNINLFFPEVKGATMDLSLRRELYQLGMTTAMREWADFGNIHSCGNDSYIAQFRHSGRFDANLKTAHFIGVNDIQWNLADDKYIEPIEAIDDDIAAGEGKIDDPQTNEESGEEDAHEVHHQSDDESKEAEESSQPDDESKEAEESSLPDDESKEVEESSHPDDESKEVEENYQPNEASEEAEESSQPDEEGKEAQAYGTSQRDEEESVKEEDDEEEDEEEDEEDGNNDYNDDDEEELNNLDQIIKLSQRKRKAKKVIKKTKEKEVAFVSNFFYAVLRKNTVVFAGTIAN